MFNVDIPDPTKIKIQTRDTLKIKDVLQPARPTYNHNQITERIHGARSHENSYYESTPVKNRVIKA